MGGIFIFSRYLDLDLFDFFCSTNTASVLVPRGGLSSVVDFGTNKHQHQPQSHLIETNPSTLIQASYMHNKTK